MGNVDELCPAETIVHKVRLSLQRNSCQSDNSSGKSGLTEPFLFALNVTSNTTKLSGNTNIVL